MSFERTWCCSKHFPVVTNERLNVTNEGSNVTNEGSNVTNKGVTNDSVFENWKMSSKVTWGGSGLSKVSNDFPPILEQRILLCLDLILEGHILLIFFYSLYSSPTANCWGMFLEFSQLESHKLFSVWRSKSSVNYFLQGLTFLNESLLADITRCIFQSNV